MFSIDISCANKARYETKEFAITAFKSFLARNTNGRGQKIYGKKVKQYPYKCDYCGGWHLTTKK